MMDEPPHQGFFHQDGVRREKNVVQLPNATDIETQAAEWVARLHSEDASPEDYQNFTIWMNRSEKHRAAFRQLESLWSEMSILDELDDLGLSVANLVETRHAPLTRRVLGGVAASIAVIAAASGVVAYQHRQNLRQTTSFATSVGAQETHTLSDGSIIQLNTDSDIAVAFTPQSRLVRLNRGEVHFDVEKDRNRPFTVMTENGAVTAIGTAFTVRMRPNAALEVTVAEGRVALTPPTIESAPQQNKEPAAATPVAELTAGQSALFDQEVEEIEQISETDLWRKLSWRQGVLMYSGEPLEDVIRDISRYTDVQIEITDPDLKALPIQGYFQVGEIQALFETLELTFGLTVERRSDNRVVLSGAT